MMNMLTTALIALEGAQDNLDALAGSGWAGAGLLGLVLCWLLFVHLPNKDKQLQQIIDRHAATVNEHAERCDAERREARVIYTESLEAICAKLVSACDALGRANEAIASHQDRRGKE